MKIEKILAKLKTSAIDSVGFQIGQYEAYALHAHVTLLQCKAEMYDKFPESVASYAATVAELDELRNSMAELDRERSSVLNDNRTLIDENGMVKMQYSQCDKDRIAALKERDEAILNYSVQREKVEACLREIKALTSERDRFKLQRDEFEKLNVVLSRDIKACESTYEDWRRQRDEARDLSARYKSERNDARAENQRTTSAMIQVGNERDEARKERDQASGSYNAQRDKVAILSQEIAAVRKELGEAYGQNAKLAQQLDESRIYESMAVGNIAQVANDRSDRIKKQEETIERIIKERDEAKACLEDVQIMLHSAVEQRDEALAQTEHYRTDNASLVEAAIQPQIKTTGNTLPPGCYTIRGPITAIKLNGELYEVLDK